jgi:hypothetical protein
MKKLWLAALVIALGGCTQTWKVETKPYGSKQWVGAKIVDMGHRPSIEDASKATCRGSAQEPEDRIRYVNQLTTEVMEFSCQEIYRHRLERVKAGKQGIGE